MSIIGRDGNNQILPIAYAMVEAETKDSWEWFLHLLLEDLSAFNQIAYDFIFYQHKVYSLNAFYLPFYVMYNILCCLVSFSLPSYM